jgi:fumarate hydratase subunit beta
LIPGFQWHAVGGKGGLDLACAKAMQDVGCIYLSFLGGGCTLLSAAIEEVLEVGWADMLVHYRLARLRVRGLGPATVGIDAHGRSLYAEEQQTAMDRLPQLMDELDHARSTALELRARRQLGNVDE